MTKNNELETLRMICFKDLYRIVKSIYKWDGLEGIPVGYIEDSLLFNTSLIFFKYNDKLMAGTGSCEGINHYGLPIYYNLMSPAMEASQIKMKYTLGEDAVLLRSDEPFSFSTNNNVSMFMFQPNGAMSDISIIWYYADMLANVRMTQRLNMKALRQPFVIATTPENEMSVKAMYSDIDDYKDAIFTQKTKKKDLTQSNAISDNFDVMNLKVDYNIDRLEDQYNNIRNKCLSYFGVNNYQTDKKERSIVDEVNANNTQIELATQRNLQLREEAAEKTNKLFGTNITVKLSSDVYTNTTLEREDETNA